VLANLGKSLAIAHGPRLPFGSSNEPKRRDITATTGGPLILKRHPTVLFVLRQIHELQTSLQQAIDQVEALQQTLSSDRAVASTVSISQPDLKKWLGASISADSRFVTWQNRSDLSTTAWTGKYLATGCQH
jgi:hypothetical protein